MCPRAICSTAFYTHRDAHEGLYYIADQHAAKDFNANAHRNADSANFDPVTCANADSQQ
jgi:hypothetical protein